MNNKYKILILRPGGNDTALVKGIVPKNERREINDQIMNQFSNIEQVGFYKDGKRAKLEMAGGEFCGNATRSLAYLLLNGKKGKLKILVSGTNRFLSAGVKKKNTAFAQMPLYKSFKSVRKVDTDTFLVKLQGITHLVTPKPQNIQSEKLKIMAKKLLAKYKLLFSEKAAGVMFVSNIKRNNVTIDPVVWVRDLETLFYETACASGTTAVGLWKAKQSKSKKTTLKVKQPTGMFISVTVKKDKNQFIDALIEGPIKLLKKEVIIL